jgi:hypothetical protein
MRYIILTILFLFLTGCSAHSAVSVDDIPPFEVLPNTPETVPPLTYHVKGIPVEDIAGRILKDIFRTDSVDWIYSPTTYMACGSFWDPLTGLEATAWVVFSKPEWSKEPVLMEAFTSTGEYVPVHALPELLKSARASFQAGVAE